MNVIKFMRGKSLAQQPLFTKAIALSMFVTLAACQTTGSNGVRSQSVQQEMTQGQKTLMSAGRVAEEERKYDLAANAYGRLFEKRTNDPVVLAAFIRTMRYSNKALEVVGYVETRTPLLLLDPNVKFEYGKALLAAGRKSEALSTLKEVSMSLPNNWQVDSALGIAFDALGQFPQAISAYSKALQKSPNNVIVLNNMAMSQAMLGKLDLAIGTLENAAGINRSNTHVRQNLALMYALKGDVQKAKSLAAMDLNSRDLETNLSFYRRFEGLADE